MTQKEYKEKIIDKFVLKKYETNQYVQGRHLIYKIEGNTQDNTQNCGVSFVKIQTPNSSPKDPFYIIFPIIGGVICYFGKPSFCIYKENDNYYVSRIFSTPKIDTITGINSIIDPETSQITSLIINGEEQTIPPIDQIPEIPFSDAFLSDIEMFDYVKSQIIENTSQDRINDTINYTTYYGWTDGPNDNSDNIVLENQCGQYISNLLQFNVNSSSNHYENFIIYKNDMTDNGHSVLAGDEVITISDGRMYQYIIKRNNQIIIETAEIKYA